MSRYILTSFENVVSSFKSLKEISLAGDFYDTIYSGRFFSRYSINHGESSCYIYIIKSYNSALKRFVRDVETIKAYKNSVFPKFVICKEEFLCYDGNNQGVYYDVVLSERFEEVTIFRNIENEVLASQKLFALLKGVRWIIKNSIVIDNFSYSQIKFSEDRVIFEFNPRNSLFVKDAKCCKAEDVEFLNKILYFAILYHHILLKSIDDELIIDWFLECDTPFSNLFFRERAAKLYGNDQNIDKLLDFILIGKEEESILYSLDALIDLQVCVGQCRDGNVDIDFFDSSSYEIVDELCGEMIVTVRDKSSGKYGYIDKFGAAITEVKYDKVSKFYESIAVVLCDNYYYAIDSSGNYLHGRDYHFLKWCGEHNRFIAIILGFCYLLDRDGSKLNSEGFRWIGDFSYGLAVFEDINGLKGYINLKGEELCYLRFDDAADFDDGIGRVYLDDIQYYVTNDGEVLKC